MMCIPVSTRRLRGRLTTVALVISIVLMLMPASLASASTVWTVSNLNDVGVGSLRNTINGAAAGDTIVFQDGLTGTIVLSSQLTIDKGLRIIGPGAASLTVSGNNLCRVFKVTSGDVLISGLTIANGTAIGEGGSYGYDGFGGGGGGGGGATGGGGGLLIYGGTVTLDSVAFTNNRAVGGNGGHGGDGWQVNPSPDGDGGHGGDSDLIPGSFGGDGGHTQNGKTGGDVVYGGNYSGGGGGYGGNANYNSYIQGGDAGSGGNAYSLGGNGGSGGNKANVTFYYNKAGYGGDGGQGGGGYGGAVALTGGSLYISNSTFTGNSATGGTGGAAGSSNFKLSSGLDWYFGGSGGNGGDGKGGAIYIGGASIGNSTVYEPGTVRIVNSTFSGNSANAGAGGYAGSVVQAGNPGAVYANGIYNRSTIGYMNLTGDIGNYAGNTFELSGPDSARSTVVASVASVSTDGGTSSVTVTFKDRGGNPVFGDRVSLIAESGNPCILPASASTDRDGRAWFTVSNTHAETVTFAAQDTTAGVTADQKVTVTFTPGRTNAGKSTVFANPSSLTANGSDQSVITVTLRDGNGNPVGSGKTVGLSQNGSSTISPSSAVTNGEGQATFTVRNNVAQAVTYTARNATDNVTVTQVAVVDFAPYVWSVNTLDDGMDVGTLRYAISNAPQGTAITFAVGLSGVITLQGPLPAISRDLVIDGLGANVTVSGNNLHRVFQVTSGTVSIKNLTVANGTAAGSNGAAGANGSRPSGYGDGGKYGAGAAGGGLFVAGGTVFIENVAFDHNQANGGDGGNGGNGAGEGSTYDDGGRGGNGGNGEGGAVYLANGSLMITNSTFSGSGASGGDGGRGGDGTGVGGDGGHGGSGRGGSIYVSAGSLTVIHSQFSSDSAVGGNGGNGGQWGRNVGGMTGGDGGSGSGGAIYLATGTLALTDVQFSQETVAIGSIGTGTHGNGKLGSAIGCDIYKQGGGIMLCNVTFDAGPNSYYNTAAAVAGQSTIAVDAAELNSGGIAFATVTVTLRDVNGLPVGSGKAVSLGQGNGSSVISPSVATTDGNGIATFRVSDVFSETVTYTATDITDGFALSQTVTTHFLCPDQALSLMTVSAGSVTADGSEASIITVTLRHINGDPAAGKTIVLSQGAGTSSIQPVSAVTNSNGQAIFAVTNGDVETVTYTAQNTTDGFSVPLTVTVTFTPYEWIVSSLADTDTPGTLRHAINYAPAGTTLPFQRDLSGTITLHSQLPVINKDFIIDASGAQITINGGGQYRVFQVDGGTVSIRNLTIEEGCSTGSNGATGGTSANGGNAQPGTGGGLHVTTGTASVHNVAFNGNTAVGGRGGDAGSWGQYGGWGGGGYGGAIYLQAGSLTIGNCQFDGNSAIGGNGGNVGSYGWYTCGGGGGNGFGGAVFVSGGSLTIADSRFSNNAVAFGLGGVINGSNGAALYEDVYVYGGTGSVSNTIFGSGSYSYFNPAPANAGSSTVTSDPSSVLSDGRKQSTITVKLGRADGCMVGSNKTVSLAASSATSTIVPVNHGLTDSTGTATFTVADTASGAITYTATDTTDNVVIEQKATVDFTRSDPASSLISASLASVTANGSEASTITVTVRFANGDTAPGKTITLGQGNGHSKISPASAITDSNGQATFSVINGYVETVTYTAQNMTDSYAVPQTVSVTFTPYTWVVNSLADTDTLGTLRHAINYAEPGTTLPFQKDLNGTIVLQSQLPAINKDLVIDGADAAVTISGDHKYRVFRVDGGTVSISNLTIVDGNSVGSEGASGYWDAAGRGESGTGAGLHITAGTVSINSLVFSGNAATGGRGGFSQYNAGGSGGGGYGGAIYLGAGSLTVNNCQFDGNSASGGAGAEGGTRGWADYGGYAGNGGNGYGGAIFVSAGTLRIADSQFLSNTVAFGQGGIGHAYTSAGNGSNGSALYADLCVFGGAGSVSNVIFGSGSYSYYNLVSADAGQSQVTASPSSVLSSGTEQATVTVTLRDAGGSPVGSGKLVALSQGAGNSSITPVNDGRTDNDGTATFTVTSAAANTVTYSAVDATNNVAVTQTASVSFLPSSSELSTMSASKSSLPADGASSSTITVTLKFADGSLAIGKTVTLSQGSGHSTISPVSSITDSNGQATFTVTNRYNETIVYTATNATDNVTVVQTVKVDFLYTDPGLSTVAVSKPSVLSDGIEQSIVAVTLKYADGAWASGKTVALSQGEGHSSISPASAITDSNGLATFTVVNGRAETVTYTAHDTTDNVTVLQTATVDFLCPDPGKSTATADKSSVQSDGTEKSTITVTLLYADGKAAPGKTVALSQGSGSSTILPASATTNSDGQATFTVSNGRAETVTYTATDSTDGLTLPQTVKVDFLYPDPALSSVVASQSSVVSDGSESSTITVTLRYASGNAAIGKTVALSQGNGRSVIFPASAITDSNGQAHFAVISGRAETVVYTATDITDNMVLTETVTVTFTPYTWVVNTLADTDAVGTLRHALNQTLSGSTIAFQVGLTGPITLGSSLPTINKDLTIDGAGSSVTISGNNQYRVFQVDGGTVSIKNLTVANGKVIGSNGSSGLFQDGGTGGYGSGGGLYVAAGTVSIDNVTFSGNSVVGGNGGVGSEGQEYYSGTTYLGGRGGDGEGGAIYLQSGALVINNSRFSGNTATGGNGNYGFQTYAGNGGNGSGGAIFLDDGSLTITNSQFESNTVNPGTSVGFGWTRGQDGQAVYADLYAHGGTCSAINVSFGSGTHSYFNSAAVGAGTSTIVASPTVILANGSEHATITVTLRMDDGSMAGSDKLVTLDQGNGHSSFAPVNGALTDNSGTATFTVTGTTGETVIYAATDTTADVTLSQTVTVRFKMPPVTLTYLAGDHGSISGDQSQTVEYGESGTAVTAVPDADYRFVGWDDGVTNATRRDSNVTEDKEVTASFQYSPYTISIGALPGGTITASPSAAAVGELVTLTVTPDPGKRLTAGSLKYNDGTDHSIVGTSFTMPAANVTVTAEFETIPQTTYTISIGTLSGGTITASPTSAADGELVTLTVIPDQGKRLTAGSLKYNDGTDHSIVGTSFIMPAANVTVTAEFETIPQTTYTISIGTLSGGTITALPSAAAAEELVTLTITPDQGKRLTAGSLKYNDGTDHSIVGTSFTMPAANVTVTAEFEDVQAPVTDREKVTADAVSLEIGYAAGDSAGAVTQSLNLPVTGAIYGSTISWESSDPAVISNSGAVTRPTFMIGDANITLTASICLNAETDTKQFTVKVLALPRPSYTVVFKDWDGTVLSVQTVSAGSGATAPSEPTREGYDFAGWSVAFGNITTDLTVTAKWSRIHVPTPPPPADPTPLVDETGKSEVIVAEPERQTDEEGNVTEETYSVAAEVAEQVQTAVAQGASVINMRLGEETSPNQPAPRVNVVVSPPVIAAAALGGNTAITVSTPAATLTLPPALVTALAEQGQPLEINIHRAPVDASAVQLPSSFRTQAEPLSIDTPLQGLTGVRLALQLPLPSDEAEREAFLNSLRVFAIHSDGEQGLISDLQFEIDDSVSPGVLSGVSFFVDKFSAFALVGVPTQSLVTVVGRRGYAFGDAQTDMAACYYKGNDTYMAIRMLEVFGVKFDWDAKTNTATLRYLGNTVKLMIGSKNAVINGTLTPIIGASGEHLAPELVPGRTMIPLRFVSEHLGFDVQWTPDHTITISLP